MFKKFILVALVLLIASVVNATENGKEMIFSGGSNPVTLTGESFYFGGDQTYSALTCFFVGTVGDMNADIDGSLDGTTFFGLYDDIVTTGGYSVTDQPFNFYRIDIDTCSTCALTITCQPKVVN